MVLGIYVTQSTDTEAGSDPTVVVQEEFRYSVEHLGAQNPNTHQTRAYLAEVLVQKGNKVRKQSTYCSFNCSALSAMRSSAHSDRPSHQSLHWVGGLSFSGLMLLSCQEAVCDGH